MADEFVKPTFVIPNREFVIIQDGRATLQLWQFLNGMWLELKDVINIQQRNGEFMGTLKSIVNGNRPTSTAITTLYTTPAYGTGTLIKHFVAHNTTAGAEDFDLYVVPDGDTATADNRIVSGSIDGAMSANDTSHIDHVINMFLPPASTLQVQVSTADTITFRGHGVEI